MLSKLASKLDIKLYKYAKCNDISVQTMVFTILKWTLKIVNLFDFVRTFRHNHIYFLLQKFKHTQCVREVKGTNINVEANYLYISYIYFTLYFTLYTE